VYFTRICEHTELVSKYFPCKDDVKTPYAIIFSPVTVQRRRRSITTANNIGVKIMGELLEIASWVGTPLGGVTAIAFVTAIFFYGRWVLAEPVRK
jgi:hypothetical protein